MENKKDKLLEEGDIITIKTGMSISVEIPEMFVYSNRRDSKQLTTTTIKVGSVLDNEHGETFDTKKFAGAYVVEKTQMTGGGTGHGPGDIYPDGHHVQATKLKKDQQYNIKGIQISFYQSKLYSCSILPNEIQAEGKMQKIWTVVQKTDLKAKIGNIREGNNPSHGQKNALK